MLHLKSFVFNPFSENTYVLFNESLNAFLVDPGNFSEAETEILEKYITENNLKIQNILLTHAHIDHVLGLQWAFDRYKVPVLMHELDFEVLERNPMSSRQFGFFFKPFEGETKFIKQNEVLRLDTDELEVLHVPGHSPGSVAFYAKAQKFAVSGDVLFEAGIGRTDLYKGDLSQLLNSIRTQLFTMENETEIFSGHGNPTTVGFEKQYNPYLK